MAVLLPLMDWLENNKKDLADNEAISNEVQYILLKVSFGFKPFWYVKRP